jgi:Dyp-type peroxidase family
VIFVGGDIFIHAKSDSVSNLFDLTKQIIGAFPERSIEKFEDVYSFVYQNGKDLSGFIDGTENPADEDDRKAVAVDKQGGSYVVTQRWIHNLDIFKKTQVKVQESWVGRAKPDSMELKNKPKSSHVARMVGGPELARPKPFQIVRQSMPYGNLSGEAGLFFIGYANSPANFEFMLNRMVGAGPDGLPDDIMRFTRCVSGTYWYFPSKQDLKKLA